MKSFTGISDSLYTLFISVIEFIPVTYARVSKGV